jgi:energy-converting hydrogenase A subunit R
VEPNRRRLKADNKQKRSAHETAEGLSVKSVFVSDCEGPISKNDNAFELTAHFVPEGDKFFALISKYDDVLADVSKKKGYNAGDTLKLILPFLKAYDVTDEKIQDFSSRSLSLIAGTKNTLNHISSIAPAFIVSTSYEHYIMALCAFIGFPFQNTYCTHLCIDKYGLTELEIAKLKAVAQEIAAMNIITIPTGAKSTKDFSSKDQATLKRLDQIFWEEIPKMTCAKFLSEVTTVGGEEKAQAIRDIAKKLNLPLSAVMYVGDSITDVQAFQLVRENGGLTVSFNGNNYAVKNAEVSVMSENNIVTAILADVFLKHGKTEAAKIIENWNLSYLKTSLVETSLLRNLFTLYPKVLPKVQIVSQANMESLTRESSEFRKKVRGQAVGRLG